MNVQAVCMHMHKKSSMQAGRAVVAADQVHVLGGERRRRRLVAVQRKVGERLQGRGRRLGDGHPALGAARLQCSGRQEV